MEMEMYYETWCCRKVGSRLIVGNVRKLLSRLEAIYLKGKTIQAKDQNTTFYGLREDLGSNLTSTNKRFIY